MTFNLSTGMQDVVFYTHQWEHDLAMSIIMNLSGIPHDIYQDLEIDEVDNRLYDPQARTTSWQDNVAAHQKKIVSWGHPAPRMIKRSLWTPGDWVRSKNPQKRLRDQINKQYYHPIILMNREPLREDEENFRKALGWDLQEDAYTRPTVIRGENPKRYYLPRSNHPNPLGPANFPWAISVLMTHGDLPEQRAQWTPADRLRLEAVRRNRRLPKGKKMSVKDLVWDRLYEEQVLIEFVPDENEY